MDYLLLVSDSIQMNCSKSCWKIFCLFSLLFLNNCIRWDILSKICLSNSLSLSSKILSILWNLCHRRRVSRWNCATQACVMLATRTASFYSILSEVLLNFPLLLDFLHSIKSTFSISVLFLSNSKLSILFPIAKLTIFPISLKSYSLASS